MAQAAYAVRLEPEQQHEPTTPQLRTRRRQRPVVAVWLRLCLSVAMVGAVVGLLVVYVSVHARIARHEARRQALQQESLELAQRDRMLNLQIDRLASQPSLIQAAQAQGLEMPTADRVHYVSVHRDSPQSTVARTSPDAGQRTWLARVGDQMLDTLNGARLRLSRGPGAPAYARE